MARFPTSYHRKWYIAKTRRFGLHFRRRKFMVYLQPFHAVRAELNATEFAERTQNNGLYAVQGHSRSPILVPIESAYATSCYWLTLIPPILYRFRDMAFDTSKIGLFCILAIPVVFNSPDGGVPLGYLRKMFGGCHQMAKVPNALEILPRISTAWVGYTSVTGDRRETDRQTDGR